MKFISKNVNLRVVLRPGLSAEPLAGRSAIPGIYVKFQNGIAIVNDDDHVKMMMAHPAFNMDFVSAEENEDPYKMSRSESEPDHDIHELKYGHVERSLNQKPKFNFPPEIRNQLEEYAKKMAAEMAPKMAMEILNTLASAKDAEKKEKEVIVEKEVIIEKEVMVERDDVVAEKEEVIPKKKKITRKTTKKVE